MPSIGRIQLDIALRALGELLATRGLHYEVVLIGGGNLILRELVTRPTTKDLDLLGAWTATGVEPMRPMPEQLRTAVLDVALAYGLANDWMNLGPEGLLDIGHRPASLGASNDATTAGSSPGWRVAST